MFVPFHVLLEPVAPGAAFAASWQAFVLNTIPLLAYAAASLVLLAFGLATFGLGLVLALPLWVASSYAAWKDIFGIRDAPRRAETAVGDALGHRLGPVPLIPSGARRSPQRGIDVERVGRNRGDVRSARTAPAPFDQSLHARVVSLHHRFDRAVAAIAHPAGNTAARARLRSSQSDSPHPARGRERRGAARSSHQRERRRA